MLGIGGRRKSVGAEGLHEQPLDGAVLDVRYGNATDKVLRELLGRHLVQPGPKRIGRARADRVGRHPAVEDEAAGLLVLQRLREKVVKLQDLHSALLHLEDEVVVVLPRFLDPDHVVEEQVVAVARGQALVGEAGPADHDGPELADLGVDAKVTHGSPPRMCRRGLGPRPSSGTGRSTCRPCSPPRGCRARNRGTGGPRTRERAGS